MKKSDLFAIPTDKDGGYALVNREKYFRSRNTFVSQPTYKRGDLSAEQVDSLLGQHMSISQHISEIVGGPSLFNELMRDVRRVSGGVVGSFLQMTIKTHKAHGLVVPRIIHASHKTMFKPVLRFIASRIRAELDTLPHLLKDSRDLTMKLRSRRFPADSVLYKIDIKDFYMSEQHNDIADNCSTMISPPRLAV